MLLFMFRYFIVKEQFCKEYKYIFFVITLNLITPNNHFLNKLAKCLHVCLFCLAEIQCLSPEIPHGSTREKTVYKESDILQYSCDQGYRSRPGISKCTKNGWIMQPACEGV